ncbi:bifunctional SulP family inorganic anion transporter/carbonic anhydrase [Planctomycetes bacterium Poly30]
MTDVKMFAPANVFRDGLSGLVVFLVALPLCLGVAVASGADPFTGLLAGIVGGLVVGILSGSHTSVSGPAAGLTAVVATEIGALGTYEAFLAAVVLAGILQLGLGVIKAGFLAEYFPTSVIKGLLAAIGVILILKQIPHLFGHDTDIEGEMSFNQPDNENTFTELWATLTDLHAGAMAVGLVSLVILFFWHRWKWASRVGMPAALFVVILGVVATLLLRKLGGEWMIGKSHLVEVPRAGSAAEFASFLHFPDWGILSSPRVYRSALTIGLVATLETLLNLEAVDRIDPKRRISPPNRELLAQGAGNIASGMIGGLPVTSVIVRSSVNIQTGNVTKLSTIFHGALLLLCVGFIPHILNLIPLASLAAILIYTGYKLAAPKLMKEMWARGRTQFLPFVVTVLAIVLTDLLIGIIIGLGTALAFILYSNLRAPVRTVREEHIGGDVIRIELGNQVSFLNKASLGETLLSLKRGDQVLFDARATDYMDPDVEDMLLEFDRVTGPARGIDVSLLGFRGSEALSDKIRFVDTSTSEVQKELSPEDVLRLLHAGNERFRTGKRLSRDFGRQKDATADGQFPLAVLLSCIDSRTPAELVFDLGLGDIFSVRIAGNVAKEKVFGSIEYSCAVAGAKLVVVMGHTRCGAVTSSVKLFEADKSALEATGCGNLDALVRNIQRSVHKEDFPDHELSGEELSELADRVARRNVLATLQAIREQSDVLRGLSNRHEILLCGAMYDVKGGGVEFFDEAGQPLDLTEPEAAAPKKALPGAV